MSKIVSESDGNTAMLTVEIGDVSTFIRFFPPHPNFAPLSPKITWGRGSDSPRITSYKKD